MKPKVAMLGLCMTIASLSYAIGVHGRNSDVSIRAYNILHHFILSIRNGKRTVFSKSDEQFVAECLKVLECDLKSFEDRIK